MPTLLEAALSYARRGWRVFPLSPRSKVPRKGSSGFKDATTDPLTIKRWWAKEPESNIGIATGTDSGIWVLDVDGDVGSKSLTELEAELGERPDTLDQQTGGGGSQLFYSYPQGREIRNKQALRPGIDVRGEDGYVVAPPSVHPSGRRYM